MMSNKGLNSNDALEESTTTSSSVMLSGMRREKEIARFLAITEYSRDRRNSHRSRRIGPLTPNCAERRKYDSFFVTPPFPAHYSIRTQPIPWVQLDFPPVSCGID